MLEPRLCSRAWILFDQSRGRFEEGKLVLVFFLRNMESAHVDIPALPISSALWLIASMRNVSMIANYRFQEKKPNMFNEQQM